MKFELNWPSAFRGEENVKGRTDDGGTDTEVTSILLAHPLAFGSGELKTKTN